MYRVEDHSGWKRERDDFVQCVGKRWSLIVPMMAKGARYDEIQLAVDDGQMSPFVFEDPSCFEDSKPTKRRISFADHSNTEVIIAAADAANLEERLVAEMEKKAADHVTAVSCVHTLIENVRRVVRERTGHGVVDEDLLTALIETLRVDRKSVESLLLLRDTTRFVKESLVKLKNKLIQKQNAVRTSKTAKETEWR
jgi:hypothetical protein